MKTILQTQRDFESRVGKTLFESQPVIIDSDRIQAYCKSLDQLDWFHFDEDQCHEAGLTNIIAPGSLTFALVHSTFFQHIELIDLKALFVGSDRFRVVRPVTANDLVTLRMVIATVESRQEGFRVAYKFEWQGVNEADPISNGMFLVRYWPS